MLNQNLMIIAGEGRSVDAEFILNLVLGDKKPGTIRSYRGAFADFSAFAARLGGVEPTVVDHERPWMNVLRSLLSLEMGSANAVLTAYRVDMATRKLSPSTVNCRLAALRTFVSEAKRCGLIEWEFNVANVASKNYRDTAGPGHDGYRAMLAQAEARGAEAKGSRDCAILRLLYEVGLRRKEVAGLDYDDFDPLREWGVGQRGGLRIIQKRDSEHTWVGLPSTAQKAIEAWIVFRGNAPGPLFQNLDEHAQNEEEGRRLSKGGIWKIVRAYGKKAGLSKVVSPHRLRHGGATRAAKVTNGNAVAVQAWGRWKNLATASIYISNDINLGACVADMVSKD